MLYALSDSLLYCCKYAKPLRLEGIGVSVKIDGKVSIRFEADKHLINELNFKHNLKKRITNRKNLGKTLNELNNDSISP